MGATCNADLLPALPSSGPVNLRCLIVDDSPEFLAAACRLLEQEGLTIAGTASSGDEAMAFAHELRPDATLVDIDLGRESGFAVAERLGAQDGAPAGVLILISTHAEDEFAELIEASPAIGFISKAALSADAIQRLVGNANDPGRPDALDPPS